MDFDAESILLGIIAFLGIIFSPIIAFFAGKRKTQSEVLLLDVKTVKEWTAERRTWAKERKELSAEVALLNEAVIEEQRKRRKAATAHIKEMDELRTEMASIREALKDCLGIDDE